LDNADTAGAVIAIVSDLVYAIMPMFCIWKLNRPKMERILIGVLMALGLCATAVVVVKTYSSAMPPGDMFFYLVNVQLWCRLEDGCLLVSASVPYLKGPIEGLLGWLGFSNFQYLERNFNSVHSLGHNDCDKDFPHSSQHSGTGDEAGRQDSAGNRVLKFLLKGWDIEEEGDLRQAF
jgi:hypothetical protein